MACVFLAWQLARQFLHSTIYIPCHCPASPEGRVGPGRYGGVTRAPRAATSSRGRQQTQSQQTGGQRRAVLLRLIPRRRPLPHPSAGQNRRPCRVRRTHPLVTVTRAASRIWPAAASGCIRRTQPAPDAQQQPRRNRSDYRVVCRLTLDC